MSSWRRCASRSSAAALALLAGAALAPARPVAAAELAGRIELVDPAGRPVAGADPSQAVVSFTPAGGAPPVRPGRFEIVTRGKLFEPRVLAVPKGSTVRFPNSDPILHNVFSVSPGNAFDLGLFGKGPGGSATLTTPGVVRVFCNVHHAMVAHVVVLETPFHGTPDLRGNFRLTGLPAGPGALTAWHEQADLAAVTVEPGAGTPPVVRLTVSRPRVPPHLNKLGRSYGRTRDRYQR